MQSRYQNVDTFRQLLIHQRGNTDDLIGHMCKTDPDFVKLSLPIEYIPTTYISKIGWKDPRTKEGEWLDKRRLSIEEGLKIKRTKPWVWYPQCQQQPGHSESGYVKEINLKFYSPENMPSRNIFDYFISSWDLADGSLEEGSSHTVGQMWAIIGNKKYLIDQVKGKWTFPYQCTNFIKFKEKYPECNTHLIEIKSNAKALIDTLEKNILEEIPEYKILKNDTLIRINPKDYGGDKLNRFKSCVLEFEKGNVILPNKDYGEIYDNVTKSILGMPKIKEKDIADCVSQFLNWYKLNSDHTLYKDHISHVESIREENETTEILTYFDNTINTLELWD
jgi:phage terminase large subunit-like protein